MTSQHEHDFLQFADEAEPIPLAFDPGSFKVLVVDDDPSVHDLTRLALKHFSFEGRGIDVLSAYSGEAAKSLLAEHPDAALLLLDVVMESEHAGLDVVRYVREELRNRRIRIVLRTGQPGSAPESQIIAEYDINDYKEKTELTARKLFTLMHACLRSFRDICTIEDNKRSLEQIIESSTDLFRAQSLDQLTAAVLQQLDALLNLQGGFFARGSCGAQAPGGLALVQDEADTMQVVAATGSFSGSEGRNAWDLLPADALAMLQLGNDSHQGRYWDDKFIGIFRSETGADRIVYLRGVRPLTDFDRHLINLFSRNAGISFENLVLREEVEETQRELVYRLGGAVETRSRETGAHVRRVAEMSMLLGQLAGMGSREAGILKHASPMHDVGKIGISDLILNKPGSLTDDEWTEMKRHTTIGHELFSGTEREILRLGGIIALEHHEKWDGSGYPLGKRGHEISLAGRITAIVDVFDALLSPRVYKAAWPLERVVELIRTEAGRHFDPDLAGLLLTHLSLFVAIRSRYSEDE